jgi:hypothetical protein
MKSGPLTTARARAYGAGVRTISAVSLASRVAWWLVAWGALLASPALHAYSNDIDMSGLAKWQGDCDPFGSRACQPVREPGSNQVVADQDAFDGLVQEMGVVLAPRDFGVAKTPGQAGMDVTLDLAVHRINNHHSYWGRTLERSARKSRRETVLPVMETGQFWVKKGLPYSLEFGVGGMSLLESRIVALGAMGKWTLNEGWFWLPDVSLTTSANRTLCLDLPSAPPMNSTESAAGTTWTSCNSDLDLLMATAGANISKTFAFLGSFTLTPFAGYQKVFVHAFAPVIDRDESNNDRVGDTFTFRDYRMWGDFVGQECGESGTDITDCFIEKKNTVPLPQFYNLLTHRNKLYAGLRLQFWALQASLLGEVTHVRGTRVVVQDPTVAPDYMGFKGINLPDFQLAGTLRVGIVF